MTDYENNYDIFRQYLSNDEHILWTGKPEKGNIFSAGDIFLIPFSLLWCGFAIFWEITAISQGAPFFFALFGVPFVLVGLYLVIGRFFFNAYARNHTFYAITNKKILRIRKKKVEILERDNLPPVSIINHRNGNGTITFGHETHYYRNGRRYTTMSTDTGTGPFSLENISDIAKVQQILFNDNN